MSEIFCLLFNRILKVTTVLEKAFNTVLDHSNLATVSPRDIYKYSNDRIKNHNKNK